MQDFGIGAGLAALAFWGFIGAIVVAGVWDGIRKRESQHETLRRAIESGKPLDDEMLAKLTASNSSGSGRVDREQPTGHPDQEEQMTQATEHRNRENRSDQEKES